MRRYVGLMLLAVTSFAGVACSPGDTTSPLRITGIYTLLQVNGDAIPFRIVDAAGDVDIRADTLRLTAEGAWNEVRVVASASSGAVTTRRDNGTYRRNIDQTLSLASTTGTLGYIADDYHAAYLHVYQGRYGFYFQSAQ